MPRIDRCRQEFPKFRHTSVSLLLQVRDVRVFYLQDRSQEMVDYFLLSRHIGVRYKEGVCGVGEVYEVCNRCTDDLVGTGCDRCSVGAGTDLLSVVVGLG